jgi:short-subunit dehydrogenase
MLLVSNQDQALNALAEELRKGGVEAVAHSADLTLSDARVSAFARAEKELGGLDILINCAGIGARGEFTETGDGVFRRVMELNFFSLVECCRLAIPLLAKGEQPMIVNIASMYGRCGVAEWSAYCSSKFAVCGFSESLRIELAPRGIDLMLVLPGVTSTDFGANLASGEALDLNWAKKASEVAERIARGMERNEMELSTGGDAKRLLLAKRIAPRWLARQMARRSIKRGIAATQRHRMRRIEALRGVEKTVSVSLLQAILSPMLALRCLRDWKTDRRTFELTQKLPAQFKRPRNWCSITQSRYQIESLRLWRHWPDRLGEARWKRRCEFSGMEHLEAVFASGRPAVLATLHYGELSLLYHLLRSRGMAVAAITGVHLDHYDDVRDHYDTLGDRAHSLMGVPRLFGTTTDQLMEGRDYLRSGRDKRAIIVAIDGYHGAKGKQIEVDGMRFHIHTGAFTLAWVSDAVVVPVLFQAKSFMRCAIHFGQPVPQNMVTNRTEHIDAARHVLTQLLGRVRRCPQQYGPDFLARAIAGAEQGVAAQSPVHRS